MDLVESKADHEDLLSVLEVCPVDYKAGAPKEGADANELWDTDKMQLGLQALDSARQRLRLQRRRHLLSGHQAASTTRHHAGTGRPGFENAPRLRRVKQLGCHSRPVGQLAEVRALFARARLFAR